MIIFIKNIPLETKSEEIAGFINSSGIPISIEDIVIFSMPDVDTRPLERYGLVWVSPKEAGARVIKRLNGSLFKGQPVTVREYIVRSADNDPRKNNPDNAVNFKEQRISDRRRKSLIIPWQINGGSCH